MKRNLIVALLFGLLALLLVACSPIITGAGNATNVPAVTVEPMPTTVAIREAQVTSMEVRFSDMNPTQPHAFVRGNLSESCATLVEPQVSFADNSFNIKVLTSTPSDRGCLQVITPFEQSLPLA